MFKGKRRGEPSRGGRGRAVSEAGGKPGAPDTSGRSRCVRSFQEAERNEGEEASLALALGGHWPTVLGVHWDRSLFVMGSAEQRKSRGDSPDNSFKEFN